MASLEDLERRVGVLETRVRATEVDQAVVNEKLNAVIGSQDVIVGTLRDHGRLLAEHSHSLAELSGDMRELRDDVRGQGDKLNLVVDWIQNQP